MGIGTDGTNAIIIYAGLLHLNRKSKRRSIALWKVPSDQKFNTTDRYPLIASDVDSSARTLIASAFFKSAATFSDSYIAKFDTCLVIVSGPSG